MRPRIRRNVWSQPHFQHYEKAGGSGHRLGEGDLAAGGNLAAALDAWIVFEDESGFSVTPPVARTWARRGQTPVIRVRGRSRRRVSIAALARYKPGERSRLIYRLRRDDGRRDGHKSFAWTDYRDLLITAHQQLGGPIVLDSPHRRMPRRDRTVPHPNDFVSSSSVTGPGTVSLRLFAAGLRPFALTWPG